jgi:hypothetical protein
VGNGTPGVEPQALEREIEGLRARLDRSLAELDRRRHELTDLRLQARKHPGAVAGAAGLAVLLLGGVAFAVWRAREEQKPLAKARRFRLAISRAIDKPERVARGEAPAWEKILAAVGTTLAVSLTKKLLDRAWNGGNPRTACSTAQ